MNFRLKLWHSFVHTLVGIKSKLIEEEVKRLVVEALCDVVSTDPRVRMTTLARTRCISGRVTSDAPLAILLDP